MLWSKKYNEHRVTAPLLGGLLLVVLATAHCGSSSADIPVGAGGGDGGADATGEAGGATNLNSNLNLNEGGSRGHGGDALIGKPAEQAGGTAEQREPTGRSAGAANGSGGTTSEFPIKHVIVIVKENHTFDNYFGSFPGAEGVASVALKSGKVLPVPKASDRVRDLCHSHECALTAWGQGKMDGWEDLADANHNGDSLAWAQYDQNSIPAYWAYAKTFALADHFFANVLGPSFPGHMFLLAAQAGWAIDNPPLHYVHPIWGCDTFSWETVSVFDHGSCSVSKIFPCFDIPSVPDVLPAGVSWKFYGTSFPVSLSLLPILSLFDAFKPIHNGPGWSHVVRMDQWSMDIQNKVLPNVVWLVNQDLDSEHPGGGSVCQGENWTVQFVNQIMQSEYWKDTAILMTWDDYGGWYDHLPPPRQYGCDAKHPYGLGFRLPLLILSPYVKPHSVYKKIAEQASIPRFIEKIFGAPPLSEKDPAAQDGQANDLLDAFDFTQTPLPPLVLPSRNCPL